MKSRISISMATHKFDHAQFPNRILDIILVYLLSGIPYLMREL